MNSPDNHEQNKLNHHSSGQFLKAPASQGSKWLAQALQLVKKSPATWLGIASFLLFMMAIPMISYLVTFLTPLALGGIIIGCRNDKTSTPLKFDHLFEGLKSDTRELLQLSGYYAVASLSVVLATYLLLLLLGIDFQVVLSQLAQPTNTVMSEQETVQWFTKMLENNTVLYFLLGILIYLALTIPVLMALWFSPALVVLQKIPPAKAIKISFKACNENFMPLLVLGLVAFGYIMVLFFAIFVLTAIINILGILLLLFSFVALFAISLASMYTCYQGIFYPLEKTKVEIDDNNTDASMFA